MTSERLDSRRDTVTSWGALSVVAAISAVLGGVVALVMVALMQWLCRRSWVVDDARSHGISEVDSSRLGGVAVFLGAIAFVSAAEWAASESSAKLGVLHWTTDALPSYFSYVFLISLVGLWDDFVSRVQPIIRLTMVLAVSVGALISGAVPMTMSAYSWLPFGLNDSYVLFVAGVLVVTGFVNAGNMADGANGLLAIIGIAFLSVLMRYDPASFASLFIMALLIFVIFNAITGQIFLGDFGAYGLSALIAFGSLELYARGMVSVWFLGSVLAYPCVEMARIIVVRRVRGSPAFQSSNDHLHNYLYELLRESGWRRNVANSSTGFLLGMLSSMMPASAVLFGWVEASSTSFWGTYFLLYLVLHIGIAIQLEGAIIRKKYR